MSKQMNICEIRAAREHELRARLQELAKSDNEFETPEARIICAELSIRRGGCATYW